MAGAVQPVPVLGRGTEVDPGRVLYPGLDPSERLVAVASCSGLALPGPRADQAGRGGALPSDPYGLASVSKVTPLCLVAAATATRLRLG